ncbi:MAG: hypothetical protein ABFD89_09895 [Bryobacteraceae bacterium]
MSFQNQIYPYSAPGVVGAIASMNPMATVKAGPGGLTAGTPGLVVGRFAWNTYAVAGGPGVANNTAGGVPRVPDGFISNQQQGLITTWLAANSLTIPSGIGITEHDRGDFFAYSTLAEASIGQKVFANMFDGQILAAAAGAFPTNSAGTPVVISSATSASLTNYTLTINTITSGTVAVGQWVSGLNIAPGTYIESFGTFNGTSGTVFLSKNVLNLFTAQALTMASPESYGGFVGQATFATSVMTVTTATSGTLAVGQLVVSSGVAAGTYITSLGTGTGGTGTYNLSTTPGTITPAQAVTASAWIETGWSVKSAGNVMDLITIGIKG